VLFVISTTSTQDAATPNLCEASLQLFLKHILACVRNILKGPANFHSLSMDNNSYLLKQFSYGIHSYLEDGFCGMLIPLCCLEEV